MNQLKDIHILKVKMYEKDNLFELRHDVIISIFFVGLARILDNWRL